MVAMKGRRLASDAIRPSDCRPLYSGRGCGSNFYTPKPKRQAMFLQSRITSLLRSGDEILAQVRTDRERATAVECGATLFLTGDRVLARCSEVAVTPACSHCLTN